MIGSWRTLQSSWKHGLNSAAKFVDLHIPKPFIQHMNFTERESDRHHQEYTANQRIYWIVFWMLSFNCWKFRQSWRAFRELRLFQAEAGWCWGVARYFSPSSFSLTCTIILGEGQRAEKSLRFEITLSQTLESFLPFVLLSWARSRHDGSDFRRDPFWNYQVSTQSSSRNYSDMKCLVERNL